jgi:hypothetical protein
MRFHDDPIVPRINYAELMSIAVEQVECPHTALIIYLELRIREDFIATQLIGVPNIFSDGYPRREDGKEIAAGN